MRRNRCWSLVLLSVGCVGFAGCAQLEPLSEPKLAPILPVKDAVALDLLFIRFAPNDVAMQTEAWREIDELHLPPDERRRLAANGLRAGVISGPLPLELEQLLRLGAGRESAEPVSPVEVDRRPPARQRQIRVRGGRRANIVVMGERQRLDELSVLLRGDDDRVQGRTYRQVAGQFAARPFPQGAGGIQLEMTPELEFGEAQKRFTAGDGMFKVEFGAPRETIEQLRFSARLMPGQYLAVTTFPDRPGTLGHQLFTEHDGDTTVQKMLLVRLAFSDYDDRFDEGSPPADE